MKKKMSKKKKITIIVCSVLAFAVLCGILYAVFKPDDKISVETVVAGKDTINETLDTTGTVNAESENSFSLINGVKVTAVNVKVGDIVKAGDVLATFDTSSLEAALTEKENSYEKAQSAYASALNSSKTAKTKIADLKKKIAGLETEISKLESAQETTTKAAQTTTKAPTTASNAGVKVSDSLVKRFVSIAKLLGVEYTNQEAKKVLTNMLSAGSSVGDISSMFDSLNSVANMSGSFDMSAFASMASSSSTSLISAQTNLVELKAQLALLEVQSDSTYLSAYKKVADAAKSSYIKAQSDIDIMKNGWVAEDKGIISEVNIKAGSVYEGTSSSNSSMDINSVISAISSGSTSDITSLLTSLVGSQQVGIKILYYPLVADISLSKYDVLSVSLNQDVEIKSANGSVFNGKVSFVSATATSSGSAIDISSIVGGAGSSSTIPAQVTIEGADSSIIVGTDIDISIVTNTAQNAVIVPVEAVVLDGSDVSVYVYNKEDSTIKKTKVELGISNDTYYQIISGVKSGDVLVKNTSGLEDGIKVSVN